MHARNAEQEAIIAATLAAPPVGDVRQHTPENLPVIVSELSRQVGEYCTEADQLRVHNADPVDALREIVKLRPSTEGGGCSYPVHECDGNCIGEEGVNPMSVIQAMSEIASNALARAEAPTPALVESMRDEETPMEFLLRQPYVAGMEVIKDSLITAPDPPPSTTCPKCGAQVLDPFTGTKCIHDIERCAGGAK